MPSHPSETIPNLSEERPSLPSPPLPSRISTVQQVKILSLSTIKYHFLGDYVQHIRLWGTTDSYSTQLVYILLGKNVYSLIDARASKLTVLSNDSMV